MLFKRFLTALVLVCLIATTAAQAQYRSLYDRLGGEAGLANIVDDWYSRLVTDPMLSDRFTGPDKTYLKNQYLNFFIGLTGGPRSYHGRPLTDIHRHLRVTEEEWDETMRQMQKALLRYHIPEPTRREFMDKLASLRTQVVHGAAPPVAPVQRTLYDRMGGDNVLKAVVNDFFDRLVSDPQLADRFTGTNVSAIKEEVVKFIGQAIGGPQVYSGRDMRSVHWRMHITPQEWDLTMTHLREALDRVQVPDDVAADFMNVVQQQRAQIVHENQ